MKPALPYKNLTGRQEKDNHRLASLVSTAARPSINTHKLKSATH